MRRSSKCKLCRQFRKKIDHYFQNKKNTWERKKDGWKACSSSVYEVCQYSTAYYTVLWMRITGQDHCLFLLLLCGWKIPKVGCSNRSSRTQHLSSYSPYTQTALTGLENLVCVHPQAVLYEIPVDVSIRATQGIAHMGSYSTSQAL